MTDVSPLPQIIAIAFLVLAGTIVFHILTNRINILGIIAVLPLGLSPYFLEYILYKFDSPYMALSILVSVFPLMLSQYNFIIYLVSVVLGTMAMCMTYQASSGVFPMLVLLLCMRRWNRGDANKEILRILILSILGYALGLVIFKAFIMKPVTNYVSNSMPSIAEILPTITINLREYFITIQSNFKKMWLQLFCLMDIAFVFVMVRDLKK